jgi:hypothetical protein
MSHFNLFDEHPLLLPAFTKPFKDELLSNWLIRLSIDHDLRPQSFAKLLFPKFSIWHKDIDAYIPKNLASLLSQMTLTPVQEIENCSLSGYLRNLMPNGYTYQDTKWILSLGIVTNKRINYGLMFCPSCLKKDKNIPYYRKQWRIALNVVCTECKVLLHDRCPKCKAPIIFFRNYLGKNQKISNKRLSQCYYCDFDLQFTANEDIAEELFSMQIEINRIITEGWNNEVFYPHLYFDVLLHLVKFIKSSDKKYELFQNNLKKAIKFPGRRINETHNKSPFNHYNVNERAEMLFYATWILKEWPNRFFEIANKSKILNSILIKGFKTAPYWYLNIKK